jgi:hypothetical protein
MTRVADGEVRYRRKEGRARVRRETDRVHSKGVANKVDRLVVD